MITEKGFKLELIETMTDQHKKVLVDFANNFLETFKDAITREELLNRINKLVYMGFERQENVEEKCGYEDAKFISSYRKIIIADKHRTSDENVIKSLLYHELIHAISYHKEKNLDSCYNQYEVNRTGLDRGVFIDFDPEYDGPGFKEGELLEEIMTEYYNTILLKKEGIDFSGTSVLGNYCFDQDYVEYHGTGYYNVAALGQIYDLLFGKELMKAKLHDGNDFRKKFNDLFGNTDIFKDMFNSEGFDVPSYSKFVAQRDTIGRYRIACKMFVELFKQKYKNEITSIDDLIKNPAFNNFLDMLIKTRSKFDETTKTSRELFLLIKELEKDLAAEIFGNKLEKKQYGVDTSNIETTLFLAIEKIHNEDENADLNNIKYSVFYDNHFKGIYLLVGDEKYIIDYRTLGQDLECNKLKKFSESGFTQKDLDKYTKEYNMDLTNAEFTTILNPISHTTFIFNNGKLYNYRGEEISINNFYDYSTRIIESETHSKQ